MSRRQLTSPQRRALWRQGVERGEVLADAAVKLGRRHLGPLLRRLGHYQAVSDLQGRNELPYPPQERLAHDLGITARQVRNQLVELEGMGLIRRYTPAPKRLDNGLYTRACTRYLLCDRRWRGLRASPLRRRRKRRPGRDVCPSGNRFPLTPPRRGEEPGGSVDNPPPGTPAPPPAAPVELATSPRPTRPPWVELAITIDEWRHRLTDLD